MPIPKKSSKQKKRNQVLKTKTKENKKTKKQKQKQKQKEKQKQKQKEKKNNMEKKKTPSTFNTDAYLSQLKNMKNKSHEFQQQLPGLLDDFKKYYVFSHKNPEVSEYSSMFENSRIQLVQMQSQLNLLTTQSGETTSQLNTFLSSILSTTEKDTIKGIFENHKSEILSQLRNIYNSYTTSAQMINNYTELYNINYINNIALVCGILLELVTFRNIFSTKPSTATPPAKNGNKMKNKIQPPQQKTPQQPPQQKTPQQPPQQPPNNRLNPTKPVQPVQQQAPKQPPPNGIKK